MTTEKQAKRGKSISTDIECRNARPGRHGAGGGLTLIADPNGNRRWSVRVTINGKRREIGLGAYPAISLKEARALALEHKRQAAKGQDPIEQRAAERLQKRAMPVFGQIADEVLAERVKKLKHPAHKLQWTTTLVRDCASIRRKPVDKITRADIEDVLRKIMARGVSKTARDARSRIEIALNVARVRGFRPEGETNPAAWRGNLEHTLPALAASRAVTHHAAMPLQELPAFVARLRERETIPARCFEFLILTGARLAEAIGARWSEIDLDAALWTIPAARMKGGREHVVPLSTRAIEIIAAMKAFRRDQWVFPGEKRGCHVTQSGLHYARKNDGAANYTLHGFRSTFRDWAGDVADAPEEIAELALAHRHGSAVQRAYRRSSALERRRHLMQAWCDHIEGRAAANVVPLRRA